MQGPRKIRLMVGSSARHAAVWAGVARKP